MPQLQMNDHELLQFFDATHLPSELQLIVKPFAALSQQVNALPNNCERDSAMRKLLESKDCAVRSALYDKPKGENTNGKQ